MIVVTGATGKLGHHVIDQLLNVVPAARVVAAVRNPDKASDIAARGVQIRHADYEAPATLAPAFQGAEKVLLISANEMGKRARQHQAVVDALKNTGVKLLAYTSILHADRSPLALAAEHAASEQAIRASGVPFVFLRNGWYIENYTDQIGSMLERGAITGAAGDGRFAAATRADFAAAAVAVLTSPGHENRVYELGGDTPFTLAELAAEVSRQSGKPVRYVNLPADQFRDLLVGAGLPSLYADVLADADVHASRGALDDSSGDLRSLIGRPTTSLADAVAAALRTRHD